MNVTQDLSFITLITNASVLVQLVMALLLAVSLMSWTYIFRKMFAIRSARSQTEEFERAFWSGGNLATLYQDATSNRRKGAGQTGALERIFEAGMDEFNKVKASLGHKSAGDSAAMLDGARRAMRAAYQREMDALESHLAFLASVGSVSPYVGLFGTVWGIFHALGGMAEGGGMTIDKIAGPVGEALIFTAAGLAVAIPAVLAYNIFGKRVAACEAELEGFAHDLREMQLDAAK